MYGTFFWFSVLALLIECVLKELEPFAWLS